ncbi:exonuclease/endonuclease/phosphatase family protein [Roseiconus lacunae]|uniref:hypothetical protein n=1 Tax=Roseiconus lacunae TaxID=2605694 RepID=UPI001E4E962B|nr:hypothetical protein [Roseiconus lacunae]MCD0462852.1 hypothetical protein [Roseiconus lacunae]
MYPPKILIITCKMLILFLVCHGMSQPAYGQLRICSFNTLSKPTTAIDDGLQRVIMSAISTRAVNGIAKRPDILALQEQNSFLGTSDSTAANLNNEFGVSSYESILLSSGSFRQSYVYDSATVTPIDASEFFIGIRVALRTQWKLVGYDHSSVFYTYCVHFKAGDNAGDLSLRNTEALNLRNNADSLGPGSHLIYMGDFNFAGHNEASVLTMKASGNGQAFDPVALPSWPNLTSRQYLTQSTRSSSLPDGGAFGGIDDRFDLQLVSGAMLDGEGISYVGPTSSGFIGDHSYHALGNDGQVYNGAINAFYTGREQPASVLDALHDFSDHLPVIADYQFPSRMDVDFDPAPISAVLGSTVELGFHIENSAPVSVSIGADELDYEFNTSGDLNGNGTGTVAALDAVGNELAILDTSSLGAHAGTITVMTFSQQAANAFQVQNVEFFVTVLGDMNGDFNVDNFDVSPFSLALLDPVAYAASFPMIDPDIIGDFNNNGMMDNLDINGFANALLAP